jgi:YjbR
MLSVNAARKIALSFPETDEKPHVDRMAFRVNGKIFSTISDEKKDVNFKLTPFEQTECCKNADPAIIHPVAGGWGRQGWTTIHLPETSMAFFKKVITVAYCNIAPLRLAEQFKHY